MIDIIFDTIILFKHSGLQDYDCEEMFLLVSSFLRLWNITVSSFNFRIYPTGWVRIWPNPALGIKNNYKNYIEIENCLTDRLIAWVSHTEVSVVKDNLTNLNVKVCLQVLGSVTVYVKK